MIIQTRTVVVLQNDTQRIRISTSVSLLLQRDRQYMVKLFGPFLHFSLSGFGHRTNSTSGPASGITQRVSWPCLNAFVLLVFLLRHVFQVLGSCLNRQLNNWTNCKQKRNSGVVVLRYPHLTKAILLFFFLCIPPLYNHVLCRKQLTGELHLQGDTSVNLRDKDLPI